MIIRFNSDTIRFGFCIFFIAAITIRTDMAFINIEKIFDTCILFLITTFVNSIFYSQMPAGHCMVSASLLKIKPSSERVPFMMLGLSFEINL